MNKIAANSPWFSIALFLGMLLLPFSGEGAIVNGDFEADAFFNGSFYEAPLTGWSVSQVVGTNEVKGYDTTTSYNLAPHSPNIAAAFFSNASATGSGASISQSLPTPDTSKTYNLSLWIANPPSAGATNNIFSVRWDGNLIPFSDPSLTEVGITKTYVVTPNTGWFQIFSTNLPVTVTSTPLVISARNNDWAILVDDVVVQETPEPSTVVMLGIGATLMGLRRLRQQRRRV